MKRHLFVAALGMCFVASITVAYAQVRADTGGIAIGGSVTGSTVIIGISQQKVDELVRDAKRPLEELTTQQRENIALLKEKLDLNERQARAALGILGENDIPPERLAAKLVEIAERFRDLQATALAQPGDSPTIITLKAEAQKAIEAGELSKADALLADVETEQRRSLDRVAVNVSETSSRRGEIASHDCVMPKLPSISPMRRPFSLRIPHMTTSELTTYKKRQALSISKATKPAITVHSFQRLIGASD